MNMKKEIKLLAAQVLAADALAKTGHHHPEAFGYLIGAVTGFLRSAGAPVLLTAEGYEVPAPSPLADQVIQSLLARYQPEGAKTL